MLKWVSTATRHSAWLSTKRTTTTKNAKKSTAATVSTTKTPATAAQALTSKSISSNFAMWLLTTVCIMAALVQVTNGFKPIDVNNSEGRKLFGGYRITPKHCRATKTLAVSDSRRNGPTICMFNHECAQRNGEVVGACMDGFLFGACCQIPSEQDLETTLLNDAQNSYYQQHQQQKLQDEYGGANQAVAQSYETYGENQQQHTQETKYSPPTFKPKPKPQRVQKPQQQQQQKYKPQLPKPIYGNVGNTASEEVQPPENSYTQTNIDKVFQQLESSSNAATSYEALHTQQEDSPNNKYQSQESVPNTSTLYMMESLESAQQESLPSVGPTASFYEQPQSMQVESQQADSQQQEEELHQQQQEKTQEQQKQQQENQAILFEVTSQSNSGSADSSTQSSSVELETDAQMQPDLVVANTNIVHVSFTTAAPPLNDDFVLDLLSTTLPPQFEEEPASLTTTGLPMRIVNGLTEPNSSSESNSFEELPVTHNPVQSNDWEANTTEEDSKTESQDPQTAKPQSKPKPKPQQQTKRPQVQMFRPQLQRKPGRPQQNQQSQQQKQKPQQQQHNHNHLLLDGAEFTHSDITHPGADADLIEDDLQFSTGYGPQPMYMEAPVRQPSPISYQPTTTTHTSLAPEDKYNLVQSVHDEAASKRPPTYGETTTGTSITTHVDSIESIILQLNGTTNHGPTYNIVSQQQPQTAAYDAKPDASASKYGPNDSGLHYGTTTPITTGESVYGGATTNYYDDVETKRPDDYYSESEQSNTPNYSPVTAQVPAYLEPVSTDLHPSQQQPEHSYVSKPVTHEVHSATTAVNYAEDAAAAQDEHTMPANNYNDVLQASSHQTHEFNKMPALGIAYPVDMSHMEEEGSFAPDIANNYGHKQHATTQGTIDKIDEAETADSSYAQVPIISGKPQRPVAPYNGMVNVQNYNGAKLPTTVVYNDVPQEVSVSSHATKVQDTQAPAASYHTPKPDTLTTIQYVDESTVAQRPTISKTTASAYLTPTTTPIPQRPQYNAASAVTSTARPISGIITSSGTRPRPRPRPKPSTTRPNNKKTKPSAAKKPTTAKPLSNYSQTPAQPANNYGGGQVQTKKPAALPSNNYQGSNHNNKKPATQPSNSYQASNVNTKKPAAQLSSDYQEPNYNTKNPAQQASNTYNDNAAENGYAQSPVQASHAQTQQPAKKPSKQPTKQSVKRPVKQPATTYQHNKPTYVKRPTAAPQLSNNNSAKPATNTYNAEPVYQRPEQRPTYNAEPVTRKPAYNDNEQTNTYASTTATRKPISHTAAIYDDHVDEQNVPADAQLPTDNYDTYSQDTKLTSQDYGQDYDKPDAAYDQNLKVPQPTFETDAYYPAPQPSNNFNQEHLDSSTHRPIIVRKPSVESAAPAISRPTTTFIYHDSEVPPIVTADDKLDVFVHGTVQSQVYGGDAKPQYADRPQYTYVHKKPGFVKVTSKPISTTNGVITPKPTLFTLITNSDWPHRPSSADTIFDDNAFPPTTPLPGFSSTSYIYSPVVTRRPSVAINTPEYVNLAGVTTNDFDDPGYYGAQNVGQNVAQNGVHPAFTQSIADTEYGVPSDDRPAFPGYYGPTPTYPPFAIPGEKLGAPVEEETYTSPNDFVNFPPVRNPNLNMSATSSAVTTDLELSTPAFVEDGVLKDKMNTLVHKIVESLQGNFDALADMIDETNNTAPAGPPSTYQAAGANAGSAATTRKPTRKPTRIATQKPTTRRPAIRVTTKQPTRRPAITTRRPATRRPTTTTRRPTTRKPTRRLTTTTTTQAPAQDELVDEEDEEDVNPLDNEIGDQDEVYAGAGGRKFKCGVRPHIKSGRIVGGKGSTFGAYPWQVLVRESTWLGLFTKNKCGGVLITNRYVITAAHCQPGFLASLVAVMGEFDISGDLESKRAVTKNVKRVIVHRQYDPATFENDLALLELESPVQFDTHIVPICMPNDLADFTGRMATVTGWGRLKYGGGVPSVLQEVQVPIIENSVCQEMFHTAGHNKKILGSFLCAGYANGQKDSCEGDSGGPLVLQRPDGRYELAGTVSHGIKCAAPYLPGVYMRTTFYKPWLRSITGVK
nr:serine protease filzig [Bactrocera oleae]